MEKLSSTFQLMATLSSASKESLELTLKNTDNPKFQDVLKQVIELRFPTK
jgi:DNA-binding phage protein